MIFIRSLKQRSAGATGSNDVWSRKFTVLSPPSLTKTTNNPPGSAFVLLC